MRIAHLSDLHLYAGGAPARRFLNKRLTGWVNLRTKRGHVHRAAYVRAIALEIARLDVDHVVITGDLTNLALEGEYELARELIERDLGLDTSRVTVVPGNHDMYTRGAWASRRFDRYLAPWLASDLPALAADGDGGRFPLVKLLDGVAVIGLSSAVPRPPFVAAGELGRAQLTALGRILSHPEVVRRTVVLAMHHPMAHSDSPIKAYLEGLRDAPALLLQLQTLSRGLLLHGHLHKRVRRDIATRAGVVHQLGATSASLHHEGTDRMAGFNVYELSDSAIGRLEAHVYSPETGTFHLTSVPRPAGLM